MAVILEEEIFNRLNEIMEKYNTMGYLLSDPKIIANRGEFQRIVREQGELTPIVDKYNHYREALRKLNETEEILEDISTEQEMKELALDEKEVLAGELRKLDEELKLLLLPKDPHDEKNIIMEIRAGAGGEEASLFAAELFRMYMKYAEKKRWRADILSSSYTGLGGIKEIILSLEGKGIYSRMKFESGVHRVQRVPATEGSGRIHTSTITVAVLPEAEEVDIDIDLKDLRVDTFCASGPGGQGVNTTYSAVRITHIPSGMVASCQDERSQIKNREKALRVLRSRLLEKKESEERAKRAQERRCQVGTGDRSEKIRTYNFPQNRITDHRIGLTLHRLESIMEGDLDEMIDALISADNAERLKGL